MKNYLLLIFLLPLIYVGSFGYYCWKKGDKLAGVGAFIATIIPFVLAIIMLIYE